MLREIQRVPANRLCTIVSNRLPVQQLHYPTTETPVYYMQFNAIQHKSLQQKKYIVFLKLLMILWHKGVDSTLVIFEDAAGDVNFDLGFAIKDYFLNKWI